MIVTIPALVVGIFTALQQSDGIVFELFIVVSAFFHFGLGCLFSFWIHCSLGSLPRFCCPQNRRKLTELNPVEKLWVQIKDVLCNRAFESLDELRGHHLMAGGLLVG